MLNIENKRGFILLPALLLVFVVSVVGFVAWKAYGSNVNERKVSPDLKSAQSNTFIPESAVQQPSQSQVPSASKSAPAVNNSVPLVTGSGCSSGRLIVYFREGVTNARQQQILGLEKATIASEYDQFNGYALNVAKGQESSTSQRLLAYSEVQAASPEGCPDAANSAQPSS